MQRLRQVFALDISSCARCRGGLVRVIMATTQPALIARILEHQAARDEPPGGAEPAPKAGHLALFSMTALSTAATETESYTNDC